MGFFIDNKDSLYNFKSKKGIERDKLLAQIKKAKSRSIHIVRSGENLGLIAKKYGISVNQLKSWNALKSNTIKPGQKLKVSNKTSKNTSIAAKPKGKLKYHTIKKGDTLWDISIKYHSSVAEIKKWNNITNSYRLKPGKKLIVGSSG